ncbi:MAG TPA: tetratricopeptide repeat protein [Streptosporangiaceae bacterium]|nr:tetratricopeptide repeat protein [Streptosporangiaceae bacterium]
MEFRVLGPVEVHASGQRVEIGHAMQRSVLAVLLLDLGRVVPTERLIDRIWGEDPPASVRNVLYGYIGKLRAALASTSGDGDAKLTRRAGGYQLDAAEKLVDLHRFRGQAAAAASAPDDSSRASYLRAALEEWRGTALAGLDSAWLRLMRDTLELQRLAAVIDLNDVLLRQGQHGSLIGDLTEQAASYPGDERIARQLMLALYRSGRQPDALRWFEQTRRRLSEDFGTDPGAELASLHQQILRRDEALDLPAPTAPVLVPRELPADAPQFTGRSAEIAALDQLLGRPESTVCVISGTPGVGKTALAVRWACLNTGGFPDGQLYVNLRGYDPGQPVSAADALAGLLRALGLTGPDVPDDIGERAARYRSLLAGRRLLILLDNAGAAEQVRPLLPGPGGCLTLVTSRDSLAGLVARDGAHRLRLDPLPPAEAIGLLQALIGDRVDRDPEAAARLADYCSRLPLSLRVAAELAAARPATPLTLLASELAGQRGRLDLLDAGGDQGTAVRAVFSWSCKHLDPAAARTFQLVSVQPGPQIDEHAAAALTGLSPAQASVLLRQLAAAHLIHSLASGYGLHDLLRAYGSELAADLPDAELASALTALFDFYRAATAHAMDLLVPEGIGNRPPASAPASPLPPVNDKASARRWVDANLANLIAVIGHAAHHDWQDHAFDLASALFRDLEYSGRYPELLAIHEHVLAAARRRGSRREQAETLANVCVVYLRQGNYDLARQGLEQALDLFHRLEDVPGQARVLGNLGILDYLLGDYPQATEHQESALKLRVSMDDQPGQIRTLVNLSLIEARLGHLQQAKEHATEAMAEATRAKSIRFEVYALHSLGRINTRLGEYTQSESQLRRAHELSTEMGDPTSQADALGGLGEVAQRRSSYEQAAAYYLRMLDLSRQTGNRAGEAEALNGLGESQLSRGRPGHAGIEHATALAIAEEIADSYEQGRAHLGLARVHEAEGEADLARRHWEEARRHRPELTSLDSST